MKTLILAVIASLVPALASAQTHILSEVLKDPTTYAPAALHFISTQGDWKSSQVFFAHGDTEMNPQYSVGNGVPMSYGAGMHVIERASLGYLTASVANNVASHLLEGKHTKLGKVERIAFSVALSFASSAAHFEQWQTNRSVAAQRGW